MNVSDPAVGTSSGGRGVTTGAATKAVAAGAIRTEISEELGGRTAEEAEMNTRMKEGAVTPPGLVMAAILGTGVHLHQREGESGKSEYVF